VEQVNKKTLALLGDLPTIDVHSVFITKGSIMFRLILGNKAYSSWSLRPWLALRQCNIPFEELVIPLYEPGSPEKAKVYSPTGKVPCLVDGDTTVWDSLAILEYLAETVPQARLWPDDKAARAQARAVSAEMHSGFMAVRQAMPMNVRKDLPGKGWPEAAEERAKCEAEVARIDTIWSDLRAQYGAEGPFLFGSFSAADAMFAPVVSRFKTYHISLSPAAQAYADTIWALPAMAEWVEAGYAEPWVLPHAEK
jgi:glutathione S-transferase